MFQVKKIGDNTFKLFNTKTNKLLAPVYKTELTAKRNAEKKNCNLKCKDKALEKFPKPPKGERMPKPKKAKESFIKVEPVKTYGTATIENIPKPKKKRKKKEKVAPRKPNMSKDVAGIVGEMVEQNNTEPRRIWNRLKRLYVDAFDLFETLFQMQNIIDSYDNEEGLNFKFLTYAVEQAEPDFSVPKSIIKRISKIIRRNKEETEQIVSTIMDRMAEIRFQGDGNEIQSMDIRDEQIIDYLGYREFDIEGYFQFFLNEDRTAFTKYSSYSNRRTTIKENKQSIQREVKEFFELLVDYFEAKANTIRAKALINAI